MVHVAFLLIIARALGIALAMGLASAILILPVIDAKCAKTDIMTPATAADAPRLAKLGMTVQGEGDAQVADNVTVFKHLQENPVENASQGISVSYVTYIATETVVQESRLVT